MAAYVIAQMAVHDPEKYRQYATEFMGTIGAFGGQVLVAADDAVELEGELPYPRTVVGQFPDAAAARAWYESEAYQQIVGLRTSSSDGVVFIIEGLSVPSVPQRATTGKRGQVDA